MSTQKTQNFSLKVFPGDVAKFREGATLMNMQNRDYFTLLVSQESTQKSETKPHDVDAKFSEIQSKISSMEAMITAIMSGMVESERTPSFYEFRARVIAETNPSPPRTASEKFAFFLDIARRYHRKYDLWPDPSNRAAFGPGLDDQQLASWPPVPR
jgi:hypothetical protein